MSRQRVRETEGERERDCMCVCVSACDWWVDTERKTQAGIMETTAEPLCTNTHPSIHTNIAVHARTHYTHTTHTPDAQWGSRSPPPYSGYASPCRRNTHALLHTHYTHTTHTLHTHYTHTTHGMILTHYTHTTHHT